MGTLASYLQQEFARQRPHGWTARREVRLLSRELEQLLGYSPRADVLLERDDGLRRLWIEFEVSRADPVANHAKFATAHLCQPQPQTDAFVAMVSPHVARGRRNLAANTVGLMRHIGMRAFQTVLVPHLSSAEVQRLNQRMEAGLLRARIDAKAEIERALHVTEAMFTTADRQLHLVGDMMEVMLNLRQWNQEMTTEEGKDLWRTRTITYFVFDPRFGDFAPSKFCAFLSIPMAGGAGTLPSFGSTGSIMTVRLYTSFEQTIPVFDGHRAWRHLTDGLAMTPATRHERPDVGTLFDHWMSKHEASIRLRHSGPVFLLPPSWFLQ